MPLISSPHTDKLLARCWHETRDGRWYRDDVPPCSTLQAIDIEDREEQQREDIIRRDPRRGGVPTAQVHDRPVYFDDKTGERVMGDRHELTEAERLYEVNGEALVNGRLVKLPRMPGR